MSSENKLIRNKAEGRPINMGVTIEKNSLRFTIVSKKQITAEMSIITFAEYPIL